MGKNRLMSMPKPWETRCERCGHMVPVSSYVYGIPATPATPARPGHFVPTGGTTLIREPVFMPGPYGQGLPVGMSQRLVPAGFTTPGTPAIPGTPGTPWASGRTASDHGCESCRRVAESAYEARQRREALREMLSTTASARNAYGAYQQRVATYLIGDLAFGCFMVYSIVTLDDGSSKTGFALFCGAVFALLLYASRVGLRRVRGTVHPVLRRDVAAVKAQLATAEREWRALAAQVAEHDRRQAGGMPPRPARKMPSTRRPIWASAWMKRSGRRR